MKAHKRKSSEYFNHGSLHVTFEETDFKFKLHFCTNGSEPLNTV